MRPSGRENNQMRQISLERGINPHAEGSCLVKFGHTHLLCTASVEEKLPNWLRGTNKGWITAEYGMLPRSTHNRMRREASVGKQSGRTQEIQRLIGRSLRAGVDLAALKDIQITLDCDVLQADGGTRTAAITGAWVALYDCLGALQEKQILLREHVLKQHIAAVSCGLYGGTAVLDMDYAEDANVDVDANFVFTGAGQLVEVQASAEGQTFSQEAFLSMLALAQEGAQHLFALQKEVINCCKG